MNSREIMEFAKEMYDERVSYLYQVEMGYPHMIDQMVNKNISPGAFEAEYLKMARQNTDWFDILFRNSVNHAHSLSVSGGSGILQNRTSVSYNEMKGEATGNDMSSLNVATNTTITLGENLTASLQVNGTRRKVTGFAYGVAPFDYAYNSTRIFPAYDENGNYYYQDKWTTGAVSTAISQKRFYNYNILNEMESTGSENDTRTWNASANIRWEFLPGLQYQGTFSYASSSASTKQWATERSNYISEFRGFEYGSVSATAPEMGMTRLPFGGILETSTTTTSTLVARNSFVYDHLFNDRHRVTLQAGTETQSVTTEGGSSTRYGYLRYRGETFTTPPKEYTGVGSTVASDNTSTVAGSASVTNKKDNKLSGYATATYIYSDRYILNGSARFDASNRFGQDQNKRFAPTWSLGAKWRVARENVIRANAPWLETLDLIASYGYQGNAVQSVSPYLIAQNPGLVGLGNYYQQFILRIRSLPYPGLGWERTKTWNAGIELSLFNGRVGFNGNYYRKTGDVLSSRGIPYENGMANGIVSGSTMTNTGYDFTVTLTPVRSKNFSWQLSLNTAVDRNEIKRNERANTINDYTDGKSIVEGEPYSTFYSYELAGLDATNGTPVFKHLDEEGLESPLGYMVKSGKFTPDFSGGLNTRLQYKRLAFYALFSVQWGGHRRLPYLYNAAYNAGIPTPEQNLSRQLQQRWKQPGDEDNTRVPSIPGVGATQVYLPLTQASVRTLKNPYDLYNLSDERVASTDMIRCRSLSLTYEFGENVTRRLHAQHLQLRASMSNPFMWVASGKWKGRDPETGDWPARRTTSLSLQMMF
ncbi:MAG: TonB-dependent receptor, partial [Odoribacteraceae bacterium]|jgi:hypothetical protein|nr:TonB-dependent receptor [Odoribacteraceae bacterium]